MSVVTEEERSSLGENKDNADFRPETIAKAVVDNLLYRVGKLPETATPHEYYKALAYTVQDYMIRQAIDGIDIILQHDLKIVGFLSAEYLIGPQLGINLINLGIEEPTRKAVESLGFELADLIALEQEPGLGNGGLGRLAACYLDSLATLEYPAFGYGIHYEFGIFEQKICDGWQTERADRWLRLGNPWEIRKPETMYQVKYGGYTRSYSDSAGNYQVEWVPNDVVNGVAYDTLISGYDGKNCCVLRLWHSEAEESFDFQAFNAGDYYRAVEDKIYSETITKVLYPNDDQLKGKKLRLAQQYFFVSCSLQDMIAIQIQRQVPLENFHQQFAIQLNDTHPAIAVAELMRLLVDVHSLSWDKAWETTRQTFGYTNHTLLPEALEKWPLDLFGSILPRHLEIIYEINQRFLDDLREKFPGDEGLIRRLSIIDESGSRYIRMAHLACVGSHAINGVAKLHTTLLEKEVLSDFVKIWPEKFSNKTNGITPRRFMLLSNPGLARLITEKIGDHWIKHLDDLRKLEPYSDNPAFCEEWQAIKLGNKIKLAEQILKQTGINVNPESLFDIQVKRIHEYKRQHLNILHIITLYHRLKQNPSLKITPRTFIFGGKAAPGYFMAKLIIKLITSVAQVVNTDPDIQGLLKVVFFPNFNVKNAQWLYPAADLSEQISLAGTEASGTGNMKFAMNGALTIGTYDGANIEIQEEVGQENFFLFGLKTEEVVELRNKGYAPYSYYEFNPELKAVIDMIRYDVFSPGNPGLFTPLLDSLLHHDPFMVLADYQSYVDCQERVSQIYQNPYAWTQMSIMNTARMGKFSSDRAIRQYCEEIWDVKPISNFGDALV